MLNCLITILYLIAFTIISTVMFSLSLTTWFFTVLFSKRLVLVHHITRIWAKMLISAMPMWQVKVETPDNLDLKRSYIIVSNHQSTLDILVGFRLPIAFKWVAKSELFWIPLIGWNMSLNRYISIKRGTHGGIKGMLKSCEKTLDNGSSVFIFPEGTRSEDGEIKSFKNGAFALAQKKSLPILPVALTGTSAALPKGSLNFQGKQEMRMTILDPIEPESVSEKTPSDVAKMVREQIISATQLPK